MGTSIGEVAASVAAKAIDFETGLTLVVNQAKAIAEYATHSAMLAVLTSSDLYEKESYLNQFSVIAGVNMATHFVVAGTNDNIDAISKTLSAKNITNVKLPVSYAFHSSQIDKAKAPFLNAINTLSFNNPTIRFVSCFEGGTLQSFPVNFFWDIVREPIQFYKAITDLEKEQPFYYIDVGPSGTLATYVKYNLSKESGSKAVALLSQLSVGMNNVDKTILEITTAR